MTEQNRNCRSAAFSRDSLCFPVVRLSRIRRPREGIKDKHHIPIHSIGLRRYHRPNPILNAKQLYMESEKTRGKPPPSLEVPVGDEVLVNINSEQAQDLYSRLGFPIVVTFWV
jgi:hypothetical protein